MTHGFHSPISPFPDINPTESWVNYTIRLKKTCGIGTIEAGRIADKQVLLRDIENAATWRDVKKILRRIVEGTPSADRIPS
jgi:hypothetical protein